MAVAWLPGRVAASRRCTVCPLYSGPGSQQGLQVLSTSSGPLPPITCPIPASVPGRPHHRGLRPVQGKLNLDGLITQPIGGNLVRAMLQQQPAKRPSIEACMHHLFWWPPAQRLALLIDLSNRMETEDREVWPCLLAVSQQLASSFTSTVSQQLAFY